MNSLWEAAKKSPFLTSANCEAKMTTDNQLVANRTIAAAAAGKFLFYSLLNQAVILCAVHL
jgi:type VI protein secretion system component Hcp